MIDVKTALGALSNQLDLLVNANKELLQQHASKEEIQEINNNLSKIKSLRSNFDSFKTPEEVKDFVDNLTKQNNDTSNK